MAWDDYYVIAYQILLYLYGQLKRGEDIKAEYLKPNSPLFKKPLNQRYWNYIMRNLYKQGYITGLTVDENIDHAVLIYNLEDTEITPAGIEYLCDNSFLKKVRAFIKETKEVVPFI